mmetsp:Transcript_96778/g.270904  ORF Transcript_96778/g.270904 Transcript_96778/m.270904 type:complete len:234 (+) Transcript_96778:138-839(+)
MPALDWRIDVAVTERRHAHPGDVDLVLLDHQFQQCGSNAPHAVDLDDAIAAPEIRQPLLGSATRADRADVEALAGDAVLQVEAQGIALLAARGPAARGPLDADLEDVRVLQLPDHVIHAASDAVDGDEHVPLLDALPRGRGHVVLAHRRRRVLEHHADEDAPPMQRVHVPAEGRGWVGLHQPGVEGGLRHQDPGPIELLAVRAGARPPSMMEHVLAEHRHRGGIVLPHLCATT